MAKAKLTVQIVDIKKVVLSNNFIRLSVPKRSKLLKGKKLKVKDIVTITLQ